MKVKEYLLRVKKIDNMIDRKLSEIDSVKSNAMSISCPIKDVNVQTSSSQDKLGDAVARYIELEEEVDYLTDKLCDLKEEIKNVLNHMSNEEYKIMLYEIYIQYHSVYELSKRNNKEYRSYKRMHIRALEEFEKTQYIVLRK